MNKKVFSLLPAALMCMAGMAQSTANDPVIMTIDGDPIYKSEFEYVYNKNNADNAVDKKSLAEYADMFADYKLKVLDAKNQGLDKESSYLSEFGKYREQLAIPFLIDQSERKALVKEAYERSKESVAVSHILIKYSRNDSVPPYVRISRIYNELQKGADFATLAKKYSDCPSAKNGGYLGYDNVFDMVYPFENVVYNTKVGTFSKPFQTQFGYHIAYVSDRRPNIRKAKTSLLFISASHANSENLADSLYKAVQIKGADFNKISAKYSDGFFNGTKDGRMPWIEAGSQYYPPDVVSAVFSMKNDGEITKVAGPLGVYIFKLDKSNLDLPFDSMKADLDQKVLQSDRSSVITAHFLAGLGSKMSYALADSSALYAFVPLVKNEDMIGREQKASHMDAPLYSIQDVTYPQSSFYTAFSAGLDKMNAVLHGSGSKEDAALYSGVKSDSDFVLITYNDYVRKQLIELAYNDLKNYNADYRNLLQEYSDGLLLFDVSNKKVWSRATNDDSGLSKFFNDHKSNYKWPDAHFEGKVIYCKNERTKKKVDNLFEKLGNVSSDSITIALYEKFMKDPKNDDIRVKTGVFAQGANPAVDFYVFKKGESYTPEMDAFPIVAVYGQQTFTPSDFKEMRGAVVADYQNSLDKEWKEELRANHKVVINKDVLNTVKAK